MMSEWCESNRWWKDAKFSKPNSGIPRNQIDEAVIDSSFFAYSVIENACYGQIPYLKANNLNIVLSTGGGVTNVGNTRGFFTCAELEANNVLVGNNIILSHWYNNTYCQWNINSFSGGKNDIDQIIFEGLNYFILTDSSVNKSYIEANTIILDGVTLKASDPYITKLITNDSEKFSILNNLSCEGDRMQYQGSFLISGVSTLAGSGDGKFIFTDGTINKADLSGPTVFENSRNEGIVRGRDILFSSSLGSPCVNKGLVIGNAIFSGITARNEGTISGTSTFISGATNSGVVVETAIFYSGTSNFGTLRSYSLFDYATNRGPLASGAKFTFSTNNYPIGGGSGNFLFLNASDNRGSIGSSGSISFISGSNNWASLTAPSAIVIFDMASFHREGTISAIATFGSGCANETGGTLVTGIFNVDSKNLGTISSLGIFNNVSINKATSANALFNSQSINSGTVSSVGTFKGSSQNISIVNNGSFYDNSYNISGSLVNSAIFCNQSINSSGSTITTLAEFGNSSINYTAGTNDFNFFENAINYGYITNEKVAFSGSSLNRNYAKKAKFYNTAKNDTTGSGYSALFFNSSANNGYIEYLGHFYDTTENQNFGVLNSGFFHNFSINNGSMRRPLVSGLEVLTFGSRKIEILDSGINNASLYNVEFDVKTSGMNRGNIQWNFNPLLIFTTSGIYNTGTIPYTIVETGVFLSSYTEAIIPSITFSGRTINQGSILGYKDIQFLGESSNYGSISTHPPVEANTPCVIFSGNKSIFNIPTSAIFSKNYGIIQNGATFNQAVNYSTIGSGSFISGVNSGSITDSATFNSSNNFGQIDRFGSFTNSINMAFVNIGYFNNSSNFGSLTIGQFDNYSRNSGSVLQSGAFFNSDNISVIPIPIATFSGLSKNSGIVSQGYYYDQSTNLGTVLQQSIFNNSTSNSGTVLILTTFNDSSENRGGINALASFNGGAINYGRATGTIYFVSGSFNSGIINGTTSFTSNCINYTIVSGQSYFTDFSFNNGSIFGDAQFASGSMNNGMVSGNVLFIT